MRFHKERAIRESPQDLQPHTLPVAGTGSSTDGRGSACVSRGGLEEWFGLFCWGVWGSKDETKFRI